MAEYYSSELKYIKVGDAVLDCGAQNKKPKMYQRCGAKLVSNRWGNIMELISKEDLISKDDLYTKIVGFEKEAMEKTIRLAQTDDTEEWKRWNTILNERTAFKYDVMDAPVITQTSDTAKKAISDIADIVDGTIDHLDRDDAIDLLYDIKSVLREYYNG